MCQSILISGLGKTGTTGVYNAVKEALQGAGCDVNCQFEPTAPDPLLALGRYDPQTPVLTKIMSQKLDSARVRYQDFDVRLMTVRDPRDVVISRLLFFPLIRGTAQRADVSATDRFIEALQAKEDDPTSWSVVGLHDLADELGLMRGTFDGLARAMDLTTEQIDRHGFHVISYEDFVDGRLDDLSSHLGMTVTNPAATGGAWLSHIPRSMSHGEWRSWFTERDVDFFGDLFAAYMQQHGYEPTERPHSTPRLDPANGSEYVRRKLASRREQVSSRYASDGEAARSLGDEDLALLVDMAQDGDAVAGYRAARALADGTVEAAGESTPPALDLARGAARRGHVDAMRLTARLLRTPAQPERAAVLEARFWDREADLGGMADAVQGRAGADTTADDLHSLQRRLERTKAQRDALARSNRYRVGSLMAELGRGSFADRRRAAKELTRLVGRRLARS